MSTAAAQGFHRDQAPKIDPLTDPDFWEFDNAGFPSLLKKLPENLWDLTYRCWNLVRSTTRTTLNLRATAESIGGGEVIR